MQQLRSLAVIASAFGLIFGSSISVGQITIPVTNGSFEDPVLGASEFFYSSGSVSNPTGIIPGWTATATGGADRGIWRESSTVGKHLDQIFFVYQNNAIAQDVGHPILPSQTYTVDFLFGRVGTLASTGELELWAGGTVGGGVVTGGTLLASISLQETDPGDLLMMKPYSLSYQSPLSGLPVGENLSIRLANSGSSSFVGFDNVRVSYIPEPSSAAMLGVGMLLLTRRRR